MCHRTGKKSTNNSSEGDIHKHEGCCCKKHNKTATDNQWASTNKCCGCHK